MGFWKVSLGVMAVLVSGAAGAGGLSKTVVLPNGSTREIVVLVPDSKARNLQARGFQRSPALASRQAAARYRDRICALAAKPPPRAKAPFGEMCSDANAAVAEMK